jgi:hypothetical protein
VRAWNEAGKVDAYFGRRWERALPEAAYAVQGPDDAPGEDAEAAALGRVFPKTVTGGLKAPGSRFYGAVRNTPFSVELLIDFAEATITNEDLGGRAGVTDLLTVGISALDNVGHVYGPDSHEVMDMVVCIDRVLERFFAFLDQRLGLDQCVFVLTADHGVSPMPERIHALRSDLPAGRVAGASLLSAGEAALTAAFGSLDNQKNWLLRDDVSLLLLPSALQAKGIDAVDAQRIVRDAALKLDWVQAAYTRDELERGDVQDELGEQAVRSFHRGRSGDVIVQMKPYFFIRETGSTHGTPYAYDTHVPLLWYGAGVPAGRHAERVGVDDLAPTLAHLLGVPVPPLAGGTVLFEPAGQ